MLLKRRRKSRDHFEARKRGEVEGYLDRCAKSFGGNGSVSLHLRKISLYFGVDERLDGLISAWVGGFVVNDPADAFMDERSVQENVS